MGLHLDDEDIIYFLHVPKTAGTTLQYYLQQFFALDEICPAQVQSELEGIPREKLQRYRLFAGHFWGLPRFLVREPRVITMVRQPVARALSNYRHIQRDANHHLHGLAKEGRLSELAKYPAIRNSQTRHLAAHHSEYMGGISDESCERLAREVLDSAEFVGVVEYSELSMSLLAYTFNWPPLKESVSLNPAWDRRGDLGCDGLSARDRAIFESANEVDSRIYEFAIERFFGSMSAGLRGVAQERHTQGLVRAHQVNHWRCDLGGAVPGSGWHAPEVERGTGTGFRWSGPGRVATLDLPVCPSKVKAVSIEVLGVTPRKQRTGISISINGAGLSISRRRRCKIGHLVEAEVPREVVEEMSCPLSVGIHVPETFSPTGRKGNDGRSLGVAVSSVRAHPRGDEG